MMAGLAELLPIFAATLLPVFLVAAAGYGLTAFVPLDGRTLGRFLFYLATPCLVFRSLYKMDVELTALAHVVEVTVGVLVLTGLLGWLAGRDQDRRRRSALVLVSAISNNGNMGMPICLFAFGEAGLALGTVYYAITSFLSNTLGVVVASAGSAPLGRALLQSLRAPVLYAATAGLLLNRFQIEVPQSLFRAVDLLAGAAIPGMLVLLGSQLRSTRIDRSHSVIWRSAADPPAGGAADSMGAVRAAGDRRFGAPGAHPAGRHAARRDDHSPGYRIRHGSPPGGGRCFRVHPGQHGDAVGAAHDDHVEKGLLRVACCVLVVAVRVAAFWLIVYRFCFAEPCIPPVRYRIDCVNRATNR